VGKVESLGWSKTALCSEKTETTPLRLAFVTGAASHEDLGDKSVRESGCGYNRQKHSVKGKSLIAPLTPGLSGWTTKRQEFEGERSCGGVGDVNEGFRVPSFQTRRF